MKHHSDINQRRLLLFFIVIIGLAVSVADAREADYFTRRKGFPDTLTILNGKMNAVLQHIAQTSDSCSESELQGAIMGALGGFITPTIETWADELPGSFGVPFAESVFAGLTTEARYLDWACCSPVFRVGNSLVSGDKLGHFLHSGYEMYYIVRSVSASPLKDARDKLSRVFDWWESAVDSPRIDELKKKLGASGRTLSEAEIAKIVEKLVLGSSHIQEDGSWGLGGTGVKSYADIASNFEGYIFWTELTKGSRPYFTCSKGKWHLNRRFKWETYVTDAWDEGLNCNAYSTPNFVGTVGKRVHRLAERNGWPAKTCPVVPEKCKPLVKRYDGKIARVLHPDCRKAGEVKDVTANDGASGEDELTRTPSATAQTPVLTRISLKDQKETSHQAMKSVVECFNASLDTKTPAQTFFNCAEKHFVPTHSPRSLRHNTLFLPYTAELSEFRACDEKEKKLFKSFVGKSTTTQCFNLVDHDGRKRKGFAAFNGSNKISSLRVF